MNSIVTFFVAGLALASAGYIEHYQGATSFSSFDLKSAGAEGSQLYVNKPTLTYGAGATTGSTDHAAHSKVVSYETKPVISTVYTAPITKTVTYTGAPIQYASNHHYDAHVGHGSECALKEQKLAHTTVSLVAPSSSSYLTPAYSLASSTGLQQQTAAHTVSQSYPSIQTHYTKPLYSVQAGPASPASSAISHSISHHYTAPASGVLYGPAKSTGSYGTVVSGSAQKESSFSGYGQTASFGAYQGYLQPAPIQQPSIDVAPPKLVHAQLADDNGAHASQGSYLSYTTSLASGSSTYGSTSVPIKTSQYYVAPVIASQHTSSGSSLASGGSAWKEASYGSSSIPVKTSQYYIAPVVASQHTSSGSSLASGGSAWKDASYGSSSIPIKTSQYYVAPVIASQHTSSGSSLASGGSAWKEASYGSSSIPIKTSQYYVAPVVANLHSSSGSSLASGGSSWKEASYGSSSIPIKTSQYYVAPVVASQHTSSGSSLASGGSAWKEASYGSSSIPIKTSQYYVAPVIANLHSSSGSASTSASSAWKGSSYGTTSTVAQAQQGPVKEIPKQNGHSYTTTHTHTAPAVLTQQYLPPKATGVVAETGETFSGTASLTQVASSSASKEPPREYLPAREYLPPTQENKGSTGHASGTGSTSYAVPLKLTSTNQQQAGSFLQTSAHATQHTSHGTAAIVSPLHVTVQKTPVLVSIPRADCSQHHQSHQQQQLH